MLTPQEAHDAIRQDLSDRKVWEERQRIFYQMRHNGIPRRTKPFPGAADLHYPLADSQIGKLAPFYFAQVYSSDLLASFAPQNPEAEDLSRQAAYWFDWKLNNKTNFFEEILATIDTMLMAGVAPIKIVWDPARKAVRFDSIEPVYFVCPVTTMDLDTADRWCHILQLTPDQYRANGNFTQDEELIKRLTARPEDSRSDAKYQREGLTFGATAQQLILWEIYQRTPNGIVVQTVAPNCPQEEIRAPYRLGEEYGTSGPFVLFATEHKDKGYYASRGIVERVAPFETYLCRLWNEKADAMAFLNRPIFTSDNPLPGNLSEIRFRPGEYVPNGLRSVPMGSPPIDIDNEMQNVRGLAEYTVSMPDYGLQAKPGSAKDTRTATEISAIGSLMGVSVDLKARIFRRACAKVYRIAWSLLRRFASDDLLAYAGGKAKQIDPQALQQIYQIEPDGSPDGWNKEQRVQRAYQRMQLFAQNPNVDAAELTRDALAEDSPALAQRIYRDPQVKQQEALTAQARALTELGLNMRHSGHANPEMANMIGQSVQARMQALQQLNPQAAQQLAQELATAAQQQPGAGPSQ